jgi:hypothetical protein
LPNQYNRHEGRRRGNYDAEEESLAREEWERDGGDRRRGEEGARLGGFDDWGAGMGEDEGNDGIVYKGRGAMKYREKKRW